MAEVVYRHFDENNELLYVGRSMDYESRFNNQRYSCFWWNEVKRTEIFECKNWVESYALERKAIKSENPKYNIKGNPKHMKNNELNISIIRRNGA